MRDAVVDLSQPIDDAVLPRRDGRSDVLVLTYPRRIVRQRVYRAMNDARGFAPGDFSDWDKARKAAKEPGYEGPPAPELPIPSGEVDDHAASAVCYALLGLCWQDRPLPGVPRRPGASLVDYGEAVADGLYELGYEVPGEALRDLGLRIYHEMLQADHGDEAEEDEAEKRATADFPDATGAPA